MELIYISGKAINIEGLKFTEKEFISFFSVQKPFRDMVEKNRTKVLKDGYKKYKKSSISKKEGAQ
jgi:hypothetical protein